jgi:hypothetical protein
MNLIIWELDKKGGRKENNKNQKIPTILDKGFNSPIINLLNVNKANHEIQFITVEN